MDTEEKALQLREQIRYPVIVKPCDGSGSKGVEKVENKDGLLEAFQEAYRFSKSKKVLVEDFFVGKEYGADILYTMGWLKSWHFLESTLLQNQTMRNWDITIQVD